MTSLFTRQLLAEAEAEKVRIILALAGHKLGSMTYGTGKTDIHYFYNDKYYKVVEDNGRVFSVELIEYNE